MNDKLLIVGHTPLSHYSDAVTIWERLSSSYAAYLLASVPGQLHILAEYEGSSGDSRIALIKVREDRQDWNDCARAFVSSHQSDIQPLMYVDVRDFAFDSISFVDCFVQGEPVEHEVALRILCHRECPIMVTTAHNVVLADTSVVVAAVNDAAGEATISERPQPSVAEAKDFARLKVDEGYSRSLADATPVLLTVKSVKSLTNQYAPQVYNERLARWVSEMSPANMFDPVYDLAGNLNQHMAEAARTVRSWIKSNLSHLLHPALRDTHEFLTDVQMTFEVAALELGQPMTYDRISTVTIQFWTE